MRRYYAGIGSRRSGDEQHRFALYLAQALSARGWTLRSGHAKGMDEAFERGATSAQIFLPWQTFRQELRFPDQGFEVQARPTLAAVKLAEDFHPAWDACSEEAKLLHARNMHIICGPDLLTPVKFVVCWTPDGGIDGEGSGGTNFALRAAKYFEIPAFNFARPDHEARLRGFVRGHLAV